MDNGLLAFIVGLVAFWTVVYILGKIKKWKKIEVYPGVLIIRSGIGFMPYKESRKRKLFIAFGVFSFIALVISVAFFYYIVAKLIVVKYFVRPETPVAGFSPLIPGVTLSLKDTIYVMFAIGIAALFHELAHAYLARATNVRIKDAGLAFFLFIPAAFVEPEEEELKKAKTRDKAMIYSAGVGANVILTLIFMALLSHAAVAWQSGVAVVNVDPNTPAFYSGLKPGVVIIGVNNESITSLNDLVQIFQRLGVGDPNKTVVIALKIIDNGTIKTVSITKPEGKSRIGIYIEQMYKYNSLVALLRALYIINLSLALINAAPLAIPLPGGVLYTDGAQLLRDTLAPKIGEKRAAIVAVLIGLITLLAVISLMSLTKLSIS